MGRGARLGPRGPLLLLLLLGALAAPGRGQAGGALRGGGGAAAGAGAGAGFSGVRRRELLQADLDDLPLHRGADWPPQHCRRGSRPLKHPPDIKRRGGAALRRRLQGQPKTQLLVRKKPPDQALARKAYMFIADFMASRKACTPRTGNEAECAKGKVGIRCKGRDIPACAPAPPRVAGQSYVEPWTENNGKASLYMWKVKQGDPRYVPFERGFLGSCAFVANGDQVLQHEWGGEIDAHDTVIRYNTPIRGFERHVGTKATLVFHKAKYTSKSRGKGVTPKCFARKCELKGFRQIGKGASGVGDLVMSVADLRVLREQLYNMWMKARRIKSGRPAAGLGRAMWLVKSGYCTSVDLYGFSTAPHAGSGKYFQRSARVTGGHIIDWDGWILKAMMDLGFLCIYGD